MEQKAFLVVKIVVKEGKDEEFREVTKNLVPESRKEAGCLRYDLVKIDSQTNEYYLLEEYTNDAALASHRETEHYKKYGPQIRLTADVTLQIGRLIL